jgi:hypothetical protein
MYPAGSPLMCNIMMDDMMTKSCLVGVVQTAPSCVTATDEDKLSSVFQSFNYHRNWIAEIVQGNSSLRTVWTRDTSSTNTAATYYYSNLAIIMMIVIFACGHQRS